MNNEIHVLSETEAIRHNPWMYIGSVCNNGAHHLMYEIVHNAIDEVLLGHANRIKVTFNGAFCEVEDNGRGIPTEKHSELNISSCEVALTRLHAGSKFHKSENQFTAGMHGVGLSCVNALSSDLDVIVHRKGRRYEQSYKRGVALSPLREMGLADTQGTVVRFAPDPSIFKSFTHFDVNQAESFLQDLTYLIPGLEITVVNKLLNKTNIYVSKDLGLQELLSKNSKQQKKLFSEPIAIQFKKEGLELNAVALWTTDKDSQIHSYVNCIHTAHGGTHVNAVRAGVVRAIHKLINDTKIVHWNGALPEVEEVVEGLNAVVSCKVQSPNFEGQTKSRFTNADVIYPIEQAVMEQMLAFLKANTSIANILCDRINDARLARVAVQRATDRIYFQRVRKEINEEVYKEQFGARSKNWHDSAVWITDEKLLQKHADLCDVGEDSLALDVCCGSGVVGASFKGKVKKIIGLDLTPEMVKLASQRLDEVHQGNVYNIPFPDNTFDMVCTREVLHLLPYPEKPVSEIYRVLKPGGQFIVGQILPFSEDDGPWMYRVFKKKQPLIFNMFQEEDFRRLLLSPGFVDMHMEEINVWESIDVWINSYETTSIHRHEIRELFRNAPPEARAAHPFKILPNGEIQDLWRWCIFSVRKPK